MFTSLDLTTVLRDARITSESKLEREGSHYLWTLSAESDPILLHLRQFHHSQSSVQLADIFPRARVVKSPDGLRGEPVLGHSELPRRHEVEGIFVRDTVRAQAVLKVCRALERCVGVVAKRWARPLQTGFDEARGERLIVAVRRG